MYPAREAILKFLFPDFPILTTSYKGTFHLSLIFSFLCPLFLTNNKHTHKCRCINAYTYANIQMCMFIWSTHAIIQSQACTHMHAHIRFIYFVTIISVFWVSVLRATLMNSILNWNSVVEYWNDTDVDTFLFLCSIQHHWFISGARRGNGLNLSLLQDENSFCSLENLWTHLLSLLLNAEKNDIQM